MPKAVKKVKWAEKRDIEYYKYISKARDSRI